MRVFLIPIGVNVYEPYFEPVDEPDDNPEDDVPGWFGRLRRKFHDTLREAEAERHRRHEPGHTRDGEGLAARLRRKAMRWIVERAAEQRLLWHLRTASEATLDAPHDLTPDAALEILHRGLKRDADRHLRWFVVNALGLVVSLVLVLVPGPNLLGYYFTFTTVGHLLAWRGARRGGRAVTWHVTPSADVTELRRALGMSSAAREACVRDVAARLGLQHLTTFFERLAVPTA